MDKFESFTQDGKLVYQKTFQAHARIIVQKAVQQSDGTWWLYCFYQGKSNGTPIRGKSRQPQILDFINEVKVQLKLAEEK